ncbi:methylenetetrahydrofolate reductase [Permianibacter aggregans]|uniref:Methylenetetrahydrofolate reductase n=1 Tax=Permianibacter aggregans TaxID=1510150 RepID=A0A4R6UVU7_9GAMM|nr:methylenetetrahydrofolate reductase [Permianibacter aggregans]QGX41558.1 methylenetetrahydrofolate reductase [Permianibacter aggregans]TDQ51361.1 5,10-methylenetetrahydrofolate reductase (NAD(P)) [Permianibacter aggregans]
MGLTAARLLETLNRQWEKVEDRLNVSFEFFPPNSPEMADTLWQSVVKLAKFKPQFVSVTYGANRSTRDRTHAVIERLVQETDLTPVPHLTCIDASREEIADIVSRYRQLGVNHIVALRGDLPASATQTGGDFQYASDLVAFLRQQGVEKISVAAYPEVHPEARSARHDLDNLKRKVDAGATDIITQFFFDNCAFLRFRDRCRSAGIELPITPGILPVSNYRQVERFASGCGTRVPSWMGHLYEGLDDDPETRRLIGASLALEQVKLLINEGVADFHFYTLNRAELSYAICHALRLVGLPGRHAAPQLASV